MRSAVRLALAFIVAACIAAPRADALPFEATLSLSVGNLTVTVSGSGDAPTTQAGVNLTSVAIPAGAAAGTASVPQTDPAYLPGLAGLSIAGGNAAGAAARTLSGPLTGTMPLSGLARVCLFEACPTAPASIPLPLSAVGSPGGIATSMGVVNVTVVGAGWTTGTIAVPPPNTISTPIVTGFLHGPLSATSSVAQAGGSFSLVTPILVSTDVVGGSTFGGYARFTMTFVPEPGTAALLAGGIAWLAGMGARRR